MFVELSIKIIHGSLNSLDVLRSGVWWEDRVPELRDKDLVYPTTLDPYQTVVSELLILRGASNRMRAAATKKQKDGREVA